MTVLWREVLVMNCGKLLSVRVTPLLRQWYSKAGLGATQSTSNNLICHCRHWNDITGLGNGKHLAWDWWYRYDLASRVRHSDNLAWGVRECEFCMTGNSHRVLDHNHLLHWNKGGGCCSLCLKGTIMRKMLTGVCLAAVWRLRVWSGVKLRCHIFCHRRCRDH